MLEFVILAHEGRFLETILKAERGMASRGSWLVANALGRFGTPSARHYDLAARSFAARIGRQCPRWKRGTQTQNRHGGAPKGARSSAEERRGVSQAPRPAASHKRVSRASCVTHKRV